MWLSTVCAACGLQIADGVLGYPHIMALISVNTFSKDTAGKELPLPRASEYGMFDAKALVTGVLTWMDLQPWSGQSKATDFAVLDSHLKS